MFSKKKKVENPVSVGLGNLVVWLRLQYAMIQSILVFFKYISIGLVL